MHAQPSDEGDVRRVKRGVREFPAWALVAACLGGFFLTVVFVTAGMLAGRLGDAVSRAVSVKWQQMGLFGRLTAAMVAWPLLICAAADVWGTAGSRFPVALITGAAGVAVFGSWLAVARWRGQRQWRQRGETLGKAAGWQKRADLQMAANREEITANRGEISELKQQVSDLTAALESLGESVGADKRRPGRRPGRRRLYAVPPDGTGPIPKIGALPSRAVRLLAVAGLLRRPGRAEAPGVLPGRVR